MVLQLLFTTGEALQQALHGLVLVWLPLLVKKVYGTMMSHQMLLA